MKKMKKTNTDKKTAKVSTCQVPASILPKKDCKGCRHATKYTTRIIDTSLGRVVEAEYAIHTGTTHEGLIDTWKREYKYGFLEREIDWENSELCGQNDPSDYTKQYDPEARVADTVYVVRKIADENKKRQLARELRLCHDVKNIIDFF